MKIIHLPAILPGDCDLAAINQQLRDRSARLDWSAVVSAPDHHLAILLAKLDLSDDADVLDLDDSTMSEAIALRVVAVLQQMPEESVAPSQTETQVPKATPAVWQHRASSFFLDRTENSSPESGLESESTSPIPAESEPHPTVLKTPSQYQIRQELEEAILADLLGPAGGEYEEIDEARVSDRYLVGLLAPLHRRNRATKPMIRSTLRSRERSMKA